MVSAVLATVLMAAVACGFLRIMVFLLVIRLSLSKAQKITSEKAMNTAHALEETSPDP